MQPASSAAKSSPANTAFKDARARARTRAIFRLASDTYLPCANAPTLNESPARLLAGTRTAFEAEDVAVPATIEIGDTKLQSQQQEQQQQPQPQPQQQQQPQPQQQQQQQQQRRPAQGEALRQVESRAANTNDNLDKYSCLAPTLVIGAVALGCASALGVGLVPVAVVASVCILGTVAAVVWNSKPSTSPIGAGSNSSQISSTTSLGGVSC